KSLRPRGNVKHAHHLYPVLLKDVGRDWVAAQMEDRGVGVGVHYRPVHLEPFYRERFGHQPGEFPIAEDAGARLLSLPFWPEMAEKDVNQVVSTLETVVEECRKSSKLTTKGSPK
ncbi:MAG: DegT/DnrJ/EryC1/StrS family aminotransferase, partial [Chloroflexota bacterium]